MLERGGKVSYLLFCIEVGERALVDRSSVLDARGRDLP